MEIITSFFGTILNFIFEGIVMVIPTGRAALGLSIIVFTLVAQLLFTPLKIKQQRSTRAMSRIQPELQKLQKKYANKKDQASQMAFSQEMRELYKKNNASPLAGCLPLLIQLPLIYGLYNVLRQPSRHIEKLGELYTHIANIMQDQVANVNELIQQVIEKVPLSGTANMELNKLGEAASLADTLSHFTTAQWEALQELMDPQKFQALSELLQQKHNYEWFLVNLVDSPAQLLASGVFLALLVPVIAGASTFIFSKVTMAATKVQQPTTGDNPNSAESMMKTMNIMMPIMMGFFSYTVPTGLALYWVSGNIIMMFQQIIVNKIIDKKEGSLDAQVKLQREAEQKSQPVANKPNKPKKKKVVHQQPLDYKEKPSTGMTQMEEIMRLQEEQKQGQPKSEPNKAKKSKNTNQD